MAAVVEVWGASRVGIRLSPFGSFNDMADSNPLELFAAAIREVDNFGLSYLHLIEPRQDESYGIDLGKWAQTSVVSLFRKNFRNVLIAAGGYDLVSAQNTLQKGDADAVAFGRAFIANPDLVARFAKRAPLNVQHRESFYGGGVKGYTDYPFLEG
jgi:N-ethylmaleimide reductase